MSDLIDIEMAISKIEPWLYSEGRGESELNMLRAVIDTMKSLPAAPRWVRCEDRLPDTTDDVLVYRGKDHVITEDCCIGGHWMLTGVTHWMSIEPPQEVQE